MRKKARISKVWGFFLYLALANLIMSIITGGKPFLGVEFTSEDVARNVVSALMVVVGYYTGMFDE